jgi:hypothetical protein
MFRAIMKSPYHKSTTKSDTNRKNSLDEKSSSSEDEGNKFNSLNIPYKSISV